MSLTRKQLREMALSDEAIDQIIRAHMDTVDALRQERDEAAERAAALTTERDTLQSRVDALTPLEEQVRQVQSDFDRYKADAEAEAVSRRRQGRIRDALLRAGANEKALTLLSGAVNEAAVPPEEDAEALDALIAPVKEQYADFFAQPVYLALPSLQPPQSTRGALTRHDISRMSAEEINDNWQAVRDVLAAP